MALLSRLILPTGASFRSSIRSSLFPRGFIPCSTIKPVIAVAALQEGFVTRDTMIRVAPRKYLNLTEALAHSNNAFFEELGRRMGFDTVSHYGRLLGLGELAGYHIPEEHPERFPSEPPALGGVARMSSFGQGHSDDAAATGRSGVQHCQRRHALLSAISADCRRTREFSRRASSASSTSNRFCRKCGTACSPPCSTARRAAATFPMMRRRLGKTGTCSDAASRLGWFVSYADQAHPEDRFSSCWCAATVA